MVAQVRSRCPKPQPTWHEVFLRMAPAIKTHARLSFGHLRGEARAEAIQNVLCIACAAVARLDELNKLDLCYPSVLADTLSPKPGTAACSAAR